MFSNNQATSEQMAAGAQQKLEYLREQLLIFLRQKRQAALKKMAQASAPVPGAKPVAGEEDLSWLEQVE
jgi:hypothetical protein